MRLGQILRAGRDAAKLTTRELKDRSGVSHSLITQIELGNVENPGFWNIVHLARALKIPLPRLLTAEEYLETAKPKGKS